jgi:hypothetical protein
LPALGPDQPFEVALDAAPNELTDITMAASLPITQGHKETGRAHAGARASTATAAHHNECKQARSQNFARPKTVSTDVTPERD